MNRCEDCGFLHYRTDPCRTPKKSGASPSAESAKPKSDILGKVASRTKSTALLMAKQADPKGVKNGGRTEVIPSEVRSSPVDTHSQQITVLADDAGLGRGESGAATGAASNPKRGRGRPFVYTDREAYDARRKADNARYERNRRLRLKAEKEAGNDRL